MSCVGKPPEIRLSDGRPAMPNASNALADPSAGGFLPPCVADHPKRASTRELPLGT